VGKQQQHSGTLVAKIQHRDLYMSTILEQVLHPLGSHYSFSASSPLPRKKRFLR
jgi:hypothetical protein